jgi:hypothetical protein
VNIPDSVKTIPENLCNGLVCKAQANHYITRKNGIGFHVRLVLAKRLSCLGCDRCGGLYDSLGEINNDWPIEGIESVESGKYYDIIFEGDEDEYYLKLVERALDEQK